MATKPALEIVSDKPEYNGYLKVSKLTWKLDPDLAAERGIDPNKEFGYTLLRAKDGVSVIPFDPKTDEVIVTHEVRPTIRCVSDNYTTLLGPDAKAPSGILFGVILGAARAKPEGGLETLEEAMRRETKDEGAIVVSGRTKIIGTGFIQGALGPEFIQSYAVEFDAEKTRKNMSPITVDGRTILGARSGDGSKGEIVVTELIKFDDLMARMKSQMTPDTAMDMTGKGTMFNFLMHRDDIRKEWAPQAVAAPVSDRGPTGVKTLVSEIQSGGVPVVVSQRVQAPRSSRPAATAGGKALAAAVPKGAEGYVQVLGRDG
jgi:hypothetical protein